jgi:hypothetical protein
MNDTGAVPGPENDLPAVRVFRLLGGKEYVIFFAAHEDELPGENVGRELEVPSASFPPISSPVSSALRPG